MTTPPSPRSLVALLVFAAVSALHATDTLTVTVSNGPSLARPAATIEVPWQEIVSRMPDALPDHLLVKNAVGEAIPSQFTNFHPEKRPAEYDSILFQHGFADGEKSARFTIEKTKDPVPPYPSKVFARYVPERLDDFAWENDRIAHRMYGPALDSPEAGKSRLSSSGIDVWAKKVPYLIVDRWYLRGHDAYHKDQGEGIDLYGVGDSRGCGGTGIWKDGKLFVSGNWSSWKVLANGPVRAVFELVYAPWDAGGVKVSETRQFTVDAGKNLHQVESTFEFSSPGGELTAAIGLGKNIKDVSSEELTARKEDGWMSLWQKYKKGPELGCGLILESGPALDVVEDEKNHLMLTKVKSGVPVRYHVGAGWNGAGQFTSKEDWNAYLAAFDNQLQSPVRIAAIDPAPGASADAGSAPKLIRVSSASADADAGNTSKLTPIEWSKRMATSDIARTARSIFFEEKGKWDYDTGFFVFALLRLAEYTGNDAYMTYAKEYLDSYITKDGGIRSYKPEEYNIDRVSPGRTVLAMYTRDKQERYKKAADLMRSQLETHPRTAEGGFWHKKRYTSQMWLDGLYMGAPFYTEYTKRFGKPAAFDDIARQFEIIASHAYDPKTGLFYHGWDEKKAQNWANKETGTSPNFWSRGMGWWAMALVDTLENFPEDHPRHRALVDLLQKTAQGIVKWQDPATGLWWQVTDQGDRKGNYLEASASSMFVYAMAKAVNNGWLPDSYLPAIRKGYNGIIENLIRVGPDGDVNLTQCCKVAGLGQPDSRDGTFEYYISEPIIENDPKAVAPFILAGIELDRMKK